MPEDNSASNAAAVSSQSSNEVLALDLVCQCLAPGISAWPGQLPSARQLCQLALQAAHNLEAHGHHVMALEALQAAQACSGQLRNASSSLLQGPSSSTATLDTQQSQKSDHAADEQQGEVGREWHDRLVTASLLRCLVDTTHPTDSNPLLDPHTLHPLTGRDAQHFLSQRWTLHRHEAAGVTPLPDQKSWRKLAQQQIKALQAAGFVVSADVAMARLQAVYDSLLPSTVIQAQHEESTESVATGGLFRSISGMSALSTPRRNSTFSR